jgi:hypothetical protein
MERGLKAPKQEVVDRVYQSLKDKPGARERLEIAVRNMSLKIAMDRCGISDWKQRKKVATLVRTALARIEMLENYGKEVEADRYLDEKIRELGKELGLLKARKLFKEGNAAKNEIWELVYGGKIAVV